MKCLAWTAVAVMTTRAMAAEPVKLETTLLAPVRVEYRGGVTFVDFGRDAYANLRIEFPQAVPAATLIVRLGEKLAVDGTIDRKPPGSVCYREMTLRVGPDQRSYLLSIPKVKRHEVAEAVRMPAEIGEVAPFRYVEIEGSPAPLESSSLRQRVVHAPFDDAASAFECSDDTLNAVWELCHHTIKATTAFGVHIDGERERISYEGDAYLNQLSHYACDLDPRVARSTFEHLLKFPTWPAEWGFHMPMIAAADYDATGDPVLAARHLDELKPKLLEGHARADGLLAEYAIVDWPVGERDGYNDGVLSPADKRKIGPEVNTVVNAFYYHALREMAVLSRAVRREDEATRFDQTADKVKATFNRVFFNSERKVYIDGDGSRHASLHANMFPLAFDLVPAEHQKSVADFVESRGMACSVYGAQYLLEALFKAGRDDAAVRLMTARHERSWWHMIELGSTMTLEAWNAKVKPNLTWNHAWGAAPANIAARYVLGVRPLTPGYGQTLIAPQIGPLSWARGKVPTPHGPVTVEIRRDDGMSMVVDIPKGMSARVVLPRIGSGRSTFDGKDVPSTATDTACIFEGVGEGRHVFGVK